MWVAGEVAATVEKASQRTKIRPPAAAGLFYAAHPDRLRTTVSELLGEAEPSANVLPKALIAPHAGYVYSGRVRRNQRLGEHGGGWRGLGEQFRHRRLQPLPMPGIEQARRRRRPDFRALRGFLHRCLDLARYPHLRI